MYRLELVGRTSPLWQRRGDMSHLLHVRLSILVIRAIPNSVGRLNGFSLATHVFSLKHRLKFFVQMVKDRIHALTLRCRRRERMVVTIGHLVDQWLPASLSITTANRHFRSERPLDYHQYLLAPLRSGSSWWLSNFAVSIWVGIHSLCVYSYDFSDEATVSVASQLLSCWSSTGSASNCALSQHFSDRWPWISSVISSSSFELGSLCCLYAITVYL